MKSPHGGKRAGQAGTPKGFRWPATIDKLATREFVRQRVTAGLDALLQAQIAGVGRLYTRRKDGKYSLVEDEAHIERLLTEGEERKDYWISAKGPSVQAFTDLLNRAPDKPAEQEQAVAVSGTFEIAWKNE